MSKIPRSVLLRATREEPLLRHMLDSVDDHERAQAISELLRAGASLPVVGQALGLPYNDEYIVVIAWAYDDHVGTDDDWEDRAKAWLEGKLEDHLALEVAEMDLDGEYSWACNIVAVDKDGNIHEAYDCHVQEDDSWYTIGIPQVDGGLRVIAVDSDDYDAYQRGRPVDGLSPEAIADIHEDGTFEWVMRGDDAAEAAILKDE